MMYRESLQTGWLEGAGLRRGFVSPRETVPATLKTAILKPSDIPRAHNRPAVPCPLGLTAHYAEGAVHPGYRLLTTTDYGLLDTGYWLLVFR